MSAARQLCLDELSEQEKNERLAASVTSCGVGTRSYNRSAEKHEVDRQREAATTQYENSPRQEILAPLNCSLLPASLSARSCRSPKTFRVSGNLRNLRRQRNGSHSIFRGRHALAVESAVRAGSGGA